MASLSPVSTGPDIAPQAGKQPDAGAVAGLAVMSAPGEPVVAGLQLVGAFIGNLWALVRTVRLRTHQAEGRLETAKIQLDGDGQMGRQHAPAAVGVATQDQRGDSDREGGLR